MISIEVKDLVKRVTDASGTLTILEQMSFSIKAAESVAITGSSGSGKSTLLGLMAGLDIPTEGEVILAGHALYQQSEDQRAKIRAQYLGFVFQSFQLLPHLTALENVMLPLELAGVAAKDAAIACLARVGLSSRLHHYPRTLSGGEQQRVSLARAFVVQPKLLFADEPTGSLDAATGKAVTELMFDLHQEHGTCLVLVTHDPSLAQLCQRQLVISQGKLIQDSAN